jgi:glucose/arabinose dehydrogenase
LTLFACFPSAVRVFFGSREIVLFLRAAAAAFLMLRRAATLCFELAMRASSIARGTLATPSEAVRTLLRLRRGATLCARRCSGKLRRMLVIALIAACLLEKSDAWGPDGKVPLRAEEVSRGLEVPWSFAFLPGGDVLVSERPGRVRLLHGGKLEGEPVLTVKTGESSEGGLLGIAVDPRDESRLFLYLTAPGPRNELQRWTLSKDHRSAKLQDVIIPRIEASRFHDGGRIRFGPDGALYVGTGDARQPERSQDPRSLNGKILRVDADGRAAPFVLGARNVEAFDWLDDSTLVVADHGPSGEMGRYANDEVSLARQGDNLGWPDIFGCQTKKGMVTPLIAWSAHALPPGGAVVYRGTAIPEFRGNVLVASLSGEHIHRLVLDGGQLKEHEVYFRQRFGRLREIALTPSGELWVATSNCDGRGECGPGKDRILRIVRQ